MEEEIWKGIPGYPMYEVSSRGRVRSNASKKNPGRILKNTKNNRGYWVVKLAKGKGRGDNGCCNKQVHRLVAEAFIEIPEELKHIPMNDLQVDHIIPISNGGDILQEDGTLNLRWVTSTQNHHNEMTMENYKKSKEKTRRQVYVYDEDLSQVSAFTSTLDAANTLDKSQGNIASCCQGALRRYLGRIWSYVPLTDIKEREEIEAKMEYQRQKNKASTQKAMDKYMKSYGYKVAYQRYYEKNKKHIRENQRAYREAHIEEIRQRARERREKIKDTEEYKQKRREQNQRYKEYIKAKNRAYYQAHKEELKERAKERYRKNINNGVETNEG